MSRESVDVVIVGAGIVGCAAAYGLASSGLRPMVIERDSVGSHASGFAMGELFPWWGPGIPDTLSPFARESMEVHLELHSVLQEETGINTDFHMRDLVSVAFDGDGLSALQLRYEWLVDSGAQAELLDADGVRRIDSRISQEVIGGLHMGNLGILDSYKLVLSLARVAERRGATIRRGIVSGIEWEGGVARAVCLGSERIPCQNVVLALGPWAHATGEWLGMRVPVRPLKGQILRLELPGPPIDTCLGWVGGYALTKSDDLVWAGTTEEEVGFDEQPTAGARQAIIEGFRHTFPAAEEARVVQQTACLRPVSSDGLPILGRVPGTPNVYIGTAAGRKGILLGPAMGQAIAGLITEGATSLSIDSFGLERFDVQVSSAEQ
jgi:glycine oxidase